MPNNCEHINTTKQPSLSTMEDCSYNSDSCSTADTTQQEEATSQAKRREISVVFWARLVVLAAIAIAAAALGVTVFRAASREEHDDFQIQVSEELKTIKIHMRFGFSRLPLALSFLLAQFDSLASGVIQMAQDRVAHLFVDLKILSKTTTAFARHDNATWPFVTLSDFEVSLSAVIQHPRWAF